MEELSWIACEAEKETMASMLRGANMWISLRWDHRPYKGSAYRNGECRLCCESFAAGRGDADRVAGRRKKAAAAPASLE